ncbi:hypothetical protein V8G54_023687 [Vigna mungo]|uniref:NADH dehydrogenase [ubiquinone] 1 beta subcomplex subunit 2 n=1 Tax=Vigna mungo TaxID=3915 RepID=A0AAQ3RSR8_VIGMU
MGGHGEGTTYKGVTIHQPKRWHTITGKGLCAVMWFWVLYRAKQDGPVVLVKHHSDSAGDTLGKVTMMIMARTISIPQARSPRMGRTELEVSVAVGVLLVETLP